MCFLFVGTGDTGTFSHHKYNLCLCLEEESFHQESFTGGWLFPETPCPKVYNIALLLSHGSLTTALRSGFSFFTSEETKFREPSWPTYVEHERIGT